MRGRRDCYGTIAHHFLGRSDLLTIAAASACRMFQISGYVASNRTIRFGRGGFQGTRPGSGAEIFVRHIREELDAPNEFFLDRKAKQLYYVVNVTESPGLPSADGFVATFHRKIMDMHGNMTSPVRNISVNGIGFRDARATYLDPHGVPSGGDWALQRSAALTIEGSEGVTVMNCVFERNDGNGIMINGYNRDTLVLHNELRWTGDNAIGAWGRTDEVSDGGIHGADGTRGEHPDNTMVVGNAVHEVGMYEKQSSMYFQAKSCRSNITGNVFFNGPRAGINFNDGYCGGHTVTNNLVFNTCRVCIPRCSMSTGPRDVFTATLLAHRDNCLPCCLPFRHRTLTLSRTWLSSTHERTYPRPASAGGSGRSQEIT